MIVRTRARSVHDLLHEKGMASPLQNTKLTPSSQAERLHVIDILRGFALFGILLVNMNLYHSPYMYAELLRVDLWSGRIDMLINELVRWTAQGKFYTLFSILFGFSFVLFKERMEEKSASTQRLVKRRLLFLFVVGILHMLFVWWGDILFWYALAGFTTLAFVQSNPRTWLSWAIGLIALNGLLTAMFAWSSEPDALSADLQQTFHTVQSWMTTSYIGYTGHYGDVFQQRITDISRMFTGLLMTTLLLLLPLFLFGMYIAKAKGEWFANRLSKQRLRRLKATGFILFAIGLVFTVLKQWSTTLLLPFIVSGYDLLNFFSMVVGDTALCLFYIALLLILYHTKTDWPIWSYLASSGRMAMSNYLLQSLVCTTLFYGYGFGMYGKIRPLDGLVITVVLFTCQLIWSKWWLRRYRQGPIELIWRKFTYRTR